MNSNINKNFPRRPSDFYVSRDENISAPNQTIARRPVRPSADLIQPVIPDTSAQMNLPAINPVRPKRPAPLPGGEILERTLSVPPLEVSTGTEIAPPKPKALRPMRDSEQTKAQINSIESTPAINQDRGWKAAGWDVLKNSLRGFLQGVGDSGGDLVAGLGGAVGGAGVQLADQSTDEKIKRKKRLGELYGMYDRQLKTENDQEALQMKETQRRNLDEDNRRLAEAARNQDEVRRGELDRKTKKDAADQESERLDRIDKRAKLIADVVNRSTVFDPKDPANAETVKAMREAGIPVIAKSADQDVKYAQDEKTGAWFITTTDKKTGIPNTRALTTSDGKQLVTTPKLVVSGENSARIADINQQGANTRNNANIQSREGIAAANLQQKTEAAKQKIAGLQKGGVKADTLLRAIQSYAAKNFKTLQQATQDFKDAGFNTDILK